VSRPSPRRYVGLRFSTPRLGIQATEDERLRLWLREVERTLNQEVEVMTATEVAKRIAERHAEPMPASPAFDRLLAWTEAWVQARLDKL